MAVIHFLQSFESVGLTFFFKFMTFFGNEAFYLLIAPTLFWLWDKEKAAQLFYIVLSSLLINYWIKGMFQMPRPDVAFALIEQGGYSFPSGHAQGSMTLWFMLALLVRERWMSVLAVVMIFLVSLSRLYLGVHYPIDVIGGAGIGLILVLLYHHSVYDYIVDFLEDKAKSYKTFFMITFVLLSIAAYPNKDAISIVSVFMGFSLVLIHKDVLSVDPPDSAIKIATLVLTGIVGVVIFWKGMKMLMPPSLITQMVRYTVVGFWIGITPFAAR